MKKILSLLLVTLLLLLLLTGCNNESYETLEDIVKDYDSYTEIVDFTREDVTSLKLAVLLKDNEVTYLYYLDDIDRDNEIIITINDEIVYEDFIVNDYEEDRILYGTFTAEDLDITETTKAELKLVTPGFHTSESVGVDLKQEFNIVTSIDDIDQLERIFIDTSNFTDTEVVLYTYEHTSRIMRNTVLITTVSLVLIYITSLYIYKRKYASIVNFKIKNPDSEKYKKWVDLNTFRIAGFAVIFILWVAINSGFSAMYDSQYNNKTGYNADTLRYEEVVSDEINLRMGYTRAYTRLSDNPEYVAFVHKEPSHNIFGDLEVQLIGDYTMKTTVYPWGYGGYNYEVNYTYISNLELQVDVYEWTESKNNDIVYESIFTRVFRRD